MGNEIRFCLRKLHKSERVIPEGEKIGDMGRCMTKKFSEIRCYY